MSHFGRNHFPKRFGGGKRSHEVIHQALLDAYAPGWDVSEGTEKWSEAYAQAVAISMIWACNGRLANQSQPMKMLENVTEYETILKLRPLGTDTDVERRRSIAGKLRGVANSTLTDIYDSCLALLGANFDGLATTDTANEVVYWPGQNPGPPGLEWSSNRAVVAAKISRAGLSSDEFINLRAKTAAMLDAMLPAWMRFAVGVGSSFVVNIGVVGQTFL